MLCLDIKKMTGEGTPPKKKPFRVVFNFFFLFCLFFISIFSTFLIFPL